VITSPATIAVSARRQRSDVFDELRPTIEPVLAGKRKVCVGKGEPPFVKIAIRQLRKPWVHSNDPAQSFQIAAPGASQKIFRLLSVLFEAGARR
jgi:hypothetical protein